MKRVFACVFRAGLLRSLCRTCPAVLLGLATALSCSSQKDSQAYVPSAPGAVQPDGGGRLVAEATACGQLKTAESSARQALGCEAVTRACPQSIRPAGGASCFQYDQLSIDACVTRYASFESCDDFVLHPCLISALSDCGAAAEGGAGGAAGAPASPADPELAAGAGGA